MESFYSINVLRLDGNLFNGEPRYLHFFDVHASDSRYGVYRVGQIVDELRKKFSEPTYKVEVARWECSGRDVEI